MIGNTVGPYRVVRKISQGGMGVVYEAIHDAIERRVAIKVLHADLSTNHEVVTRFFNEAKAVNRIDHPGIVQCHDFGHLADGTAFIVMEYLKGETLSRRNRRMHDRMPLSDIVRLVRQIAAALAAAHAKNIVHRDLKPDNVMITRSVRRGENERTKLLDFGIAKLFEENSYHIKTKTSAVMGTPIYMSPEQCEAHSSVDAKADVYSLGVMLYEMLAGHAPFLGSSAAVMGMHILNAPPPLQAQAPDLPRALAQLVQAMLAKEAQERPTIPQVIETLEGILRGELHTAPPGPRSDRPHHSLRERS